MDPLQDPLWNDEEPDARAAPVNPELLARRRHFRTWVGRGMGGLVLFTIVAVLAHGVGQRSTSEAARSSASASEPHPVDSPVSSKAPIVTPAMPGPLAAAAAAPAVVTGAGESLRDVALPPSADTAGLTRWSRLARSATIEEFAEVDAKLAKLVAKRPSSIRDRARLARAILWRERGRGADAHALFDDLALHAKNRDVRALARSNQTH